MAEQEKLLQWHAAFFAGIQIELEQEANHLVFENEHMLGTKPMQVDILIIKKDTEHIVQKNIGRIFKTYNIIEYKSPEDYLSIDDFYKVQGYACFYKADTQTVNEIKVDELTVTYVCSHYPQTLIRHLTKDRNLSVSTQENGIYHILGGYFAMQIIVTTKLSKANNLWLRSLTNDLQETEEVERLIQEYRKHREDKLYSSVIDIIVRANTKKFNEVKQMCDALKELMKDELEAKKQEGVSIGISQGISQGSQTKLEELILKKIKKNKTIEQIADELETDLQEILPIYNRLQKEPYYSLVPRKQ